MKLVQQHIEERVWKFVRRNGHLQARKIGTLEVQSTITEQIEDPVARVVWSSPVDDLMVALREGTE